MTVSPPRVTATGSAFRSELLDAGVLLATSVEGVYGTSAVYERIVSGVGALVTRLGGGRFEAVHFPPVLDRSTFDRTDYLRSFPNLMGSIHVFRGDDRRHAELIGRYESDGAFGELLEPAETVLCSAACHAVYPLCAGSLPPDGRRLEISGYCFRHEPSPDPARMQSFRMHELVYVGEPDAACAHRDEGLVAGVTMLRSLGLPVDEVVANDPFFGRLGTLLTRSQLERASKIEGVTPITSEESPTAVMSANYAEDHFASAFGIRLPDGRVAHSACVAFGLDRIALALLSRHGLDVSAWPGEVGRRLWP